MKTIYVLVFLPLLIPGFSSKILAQNKPLANSGFEIGIDLARYNRDWVYYYNRHPTDGTSHSFDFIPSIFFKLPKEKYSIRLKYEYFKKNYSSRTNTIDFYESFEGGFTENRIFVGIQKFLINKKLQIYYLSDLGLSLANYEGKYAYPSLDYTSSILEYFDFTQFSISLQPGLGMKFYLSNNLALNLESSIFIAKGFQKSENDHFLQNLRLTPRPISLFGISYKFNKIK
jgi:hypothetical protein